MHGACELAVRHRGSTGHSRPDRVGFRIDRTGHLPQCGLMNCASCGGALEASSSVCPFCGVRNDVDLRGIDFHDLGAEGNLPCPDCQTPLGVIEIQTEPKVRVERCPACFGLFFNPGELEAILDANTNSLVWLDKEGLRQVAAEYGFHHEVVYLKCPFCAERMSQINFGGTSGVVLDQCGSHGVWLQSTELRRLLEWWHVGGKLLYQRNEEERAKRLTGSGRRDGGGAGLGMPGSAAWGMLYPEADENLGKANALSALARLGEWLVSRA